MKKILSLFVTITLLMVQFTGCQNMADIHIDPFEHPEEEPKHTVKLDYHKSMDLEYTTGEEVSIYLQGYKAAHTFVGVTFVDANTGVDLDVPYTQSWVKEKDGEVLRAYFTMPDADIILYKVIIESVPANEKSRANYCVCSVGDSLKENFKFAYYYYLGEEYIPEKHKNVVKEKTGVYLHYWFYEITPVWIDNSELCEHGIHYNNAYIYYFYISGLDDVVDSLRLMTENESGKSWHRIHDNTFKYF